MRAPKVGSKRLFDPVGIDIFDRKRNTPTPGAIVTVTQPYGCPKNGTMDHCYVQGDKGLALVHLNSIIRGVK